MGEPKGPYWVWQELDGGVWKWGVNHTDECPGTTRTEADADAAIAAHRRAVLASTGMDPDALEELPSFLRTVWATCRAASEVITGGSPALAAMVSLSEDIASNLGIDLEEGSDG